MRRFRAEARFRPIGRTTAAYGVDRRLRLVEVCSDGGKNVSPAAPSFSSTSTPTQFCPPLSASRPSHRSSSLSSLPGRPTNKSLSLITASDQAFRSPVVMVTGTPLHLQVLPSPLASIDEEDDAVLDEYILDDSQPADMAAPPFSPSHNVFQSPPYLSPDEEQWPSYHVNFTGPSFNAVNTSSAHGIHPPLNHTGLPHDQSAYPMYGEHPASWQPINLGARAQQPPSGANTLSSPYDIKVEDNSSSGAMVPSNGLPMNGPPDQPIHYGPSMASPQSENGWVSASSTSDHSNKHNQREAATRQFATFPSHLRREGIRKKNARVEIPDGRTIDTIEEEIKMCDPNDESKLKELKQYKRLLRNREAAYVSAPLPSLDFI